jgi:serine/threonine protein kinase/Tol biopolymer transport system component
MAALGLMDLSGRTLAHYEVVERLGEGSVGTVYKARDTKLDRLVALKILPSYRAGDDETAERFEREARAISTLNHPNIATIYAIERAAGLLFLVLEYLPGGTLQTKLSDLRARSERLSVQEIIDHGLQISSGLAHAHQRGVLHRDVKSENVLFAEDGSLKVTDFGLAKMQLDQSLTEEGSVLGTPAYMAPEQFQGHQSDHRADVYSFGVLLYELAAGRLPFDTYHDAALQYDVVNTRPPALREIRQDLPAALEHLVDRMLEKDPARRPASMSAVVAELQGLRERFRSSTSDAAEDSPQQPGRTVSSGDMLGHYRLESLVGEGGMGAVYKATDTQLDRSVAIKVLHSHAVANPQRKRRFIQEAKTASALNHPNIVTIHNIGEDAGTLYIAMEHVAGRTLDQLLAQGAMPLATALNYSIEIADALAAAHAAGIVHRDLKPANVIVDDNGNVKLVDFGLAKLIEFDESAADGQAPKTEEGVILGTVAYMSPEQAEGKQIDSRADIFSFGSMFYEMVTGRRPFSGDSKMSVLAGILHREPQPPEQLVEGLAPGVARVINRCLRKAPERRFQHMEDLRVALEELREEVDSQDDLQFSGSGFVSQIRRRVKALDRRSVTTGLAAGIVLASALWWLGGRSASDQSVDETASTEKLMLGQLTPSSGLAMGPSWSPDGQWIVYASDEDGNLDLWKAPPSGGEPVRLTEEPTDETDPAWSPDGRTIAFARRGNSPGIYLIPEGGGETLKVSDIGRHPAWSPDGLTLAFDWTGSIYTVPYGGGRPKQIISVSDDPNVRWLPDGEHLIFWNRTQGDISIVRLDDMSVRHLGLIPTGQEAAGISISVQRDLLAYSLGAFGGNKNIWLVRFDAAAGELIGKPRQLTITTTNDEQVRFSPDGSQIAYAVKHIQRHLWGLTLDPSSGLATGEAHAITFANQLNYYPTATSDGNFLVWTAQNAGQGVLYYKQDGEQAEHKLTQEWDRSVREIGPALSPDGMQVSFASTIGGSYQIWKKPRLNSVGLQLTKTEAPVRDGQTAWSPAGDLIAFYSTRAGNWDIWTVNPTGGTPPSQLTNWEGNEQYPAWSPSGEELAFLADRDGSPDIWKLNTVSGSIDPFIVHPAEEGPMAWSPDGRFFYFSSNRNGYFDIWMVPSEGGEAQLVSNLEGRLPEVGLYTKFAVTERELIVPIENQRGEIYLLEGF